MNKYITIYPLSQLLQYKVKLTLLGSIRQKTLDRTYYGKCRDTSSSKCTFWQETQAIKDRTCRMHNKAGAKNGNQKPGRVRKQRHLLSRQKSALKNVTLMKVQRKCTN